MSTSICNNRFAIPAIDIDECIGLSLLTINNNFKDLKQENCLTHDELNLVQNNLNALYTNYAALSTLNSLGRFAKAWISFNGTTNPPTAISAFNVLSVQKYNTGTYGLSFANVLLSSYCLVGSALSGIVQTVPVTTFTSTSATINIRTPAGSSIDSEYISITVFSL